MMILLHYIEPKAVSISFTIVSFSSGVLTVFNFSDKALDFSTLARDLSSVLTNLACARILSAFDISLAIWAGTGMVLVPLVTGGACE